MVGHDTHSTDAHAMPPPPNPNPKPKTPPPQLPPIPASPHLLRCRCSKRSAAAASRRDPAAAAGWPSASTGAVYWHSGRSTCNRKRGGAKIGIGGLQGCLEKRYNGCSMGGWG